MQSGAADNAARPRGRSGHRSGGGSRLAAAAGGVVFLVNNGIGLGHLRRGLLLATELHHLAPDLGVTLISQAASLLLHRGASVPVINFPPLHRLPSNAIERTHLELLDQILDELAPSMVVEDTYPDPHYLGLPSLRECRRVLVQRRIDAISFERFRREGAFAAYDRVLLVQSEREFQDEDHTPASRLLVEQGGRFRLLGPVYRQPTPAELQAAADRYPSGGHPLIVVTAGGGGDHFNDAYCERLFTAIAAVARRFLAEELPARFVFVLGPYYAGAQPPPLPNLTTTAYEPLLPAVLHQARVVVARPGHNVVHETLSGPAALVLAAGISWMESQPQHTQRLARLPGVFTGDLDEPASLERAVRDALAVPPPAMPRIEPPATRAVAHALLEELAAARPRSHQVLSRVFLLVRGAEAPARRVQIRRHLPAACLLAAGEEVAMLSALRDRPAGATRCLYLDVAPSPALHPEQLRHRGVRVLLFPDYGGTADAARAWVRHHGGIAAGLLPIELYRLRANPQRPDQLTARSAQLLRQEPVAAVELDLTAVADEDLGSYAPALAQALHRAGLHLADLNELARAKASMHLDGA